MSVHMSIYLPDDVFRVVSERAVQAGIQSHTLVEAAITRSVRGKKKGAGTWRPPLDEESAKRRDKRVKLLHSKGWSDNKIGADVGCSGRNVGDIRRRLKLPPNFAKFGEEDPDAAVEAPKAVPPEAV